MPDNAIETVPAPTTEPQTDCEDCGDATPESDLCERAGREVCQTCAANYHECDDCGTQCHEDDLEDRGREVCGDCARNYVLCHACDEWICADDTRWSPDGARSYCFSCWEDRFFTCDDCGDAMPLSDYSHDGLCHNCAGDCAPPALRRLAPYNGPTGFLSARYFAVEIECIDHARAEAELRTAGWGAPGDGSLSTGGSEYVSGPLVGQSGIDRIESASEILSRAHTRIDSSCGLHIHLDAQNESAETVARFLRVCARLQPWAFSVVPSGRRGTQYSQRLPSGAMDVRDASDLEFLVYDSDDRAYVNRSKREKYHARRYWWVNIHSWYYRGTVEIRLHSGTMRAQKILAWVEYWQKALDWCATADDCAADAVSDGWAFGELIGVRQTTMDYFGRRAAELN